MYIERTLLLKKIERELRNKTTRVKSPRNNEIQSDQSILGLSQHSTPSITIMRVEGGCLSLLVVEGKRDSRDFMYCLIKCYVKCMY